MVSGWGVAGSWGRIDRLPSFYLQVVGRKRFVIIRPDAHRQLRVQPALHPAHRSAQVDLRAADGLAQPLEGLEVVLAPGDILFLPAFFFHQVTTLDFAISVNAWSTFAPSTLVDEARLFPLPMTEDLQTLEDRAQVLRGFLLLLLTDLEMPEDEDLDLASVESPPGVDWAPYQRFIKAHLLDSRYRNMPLLVPESPPAGQPAGGGAHTITLATVLDPAVVPGSPRWPRFCDNPAHLDSLLASSGFLTHSLRRSLEEVASLLSEGLTEAGALRSSLLLANYIEFAVEHCVGARFAHQFLYDFIYC